MKNLLLVLTILMTTPLLAKTIYGKINVSGEPLRVKRDDGFKSSFYRGAYHIELNLFRRIGTLRILRNQIWTDVSINIPRDLRLPQNGNFSLPANRTGQTFNISGTVKTDIHEGEEIHVIESCSYYGRRRICRGPHYDRRCRWERTFIRGEQDVSFYYRTEIMDLTTKFDSAPQTAAAISFKGDHEIKQKIETHRGRCY